MRTPGAWSIKTRTLGSILKKTRTPGEQVEIEDAESGSAIVEFVIFAIPIFLPLIIYLNSLGFLSSSELHLQNLARQSLRAFVTTEESESTFSDGLTRAEFVINEAQFEHSISISVNCWPQDCFTPGALAQLTLYQEIQTGDQNRRVIATVREYVDLWRNG